VGERVSERVCARVCYMLLLWPDISGEKAGRRKRGAQRMPAERGVSRSWGGGGGKGKTESRDLKDLNPLDGNALTHAVIRKRLEPAPPTLIHIVRQPADNRSRETSGAVEVPADCHRYVREEERPVIAVGHI
jgi:hypothetical protein